MPRLAQLQARCLARSARSATLAPQLEPLQPRPQPLLPTVLIVLASAQVPMYIGAIHAALEEILGLPISGHSLKDCLSRQARGNCSLLRRTRRGWYRLR